MAVTVAHLIERALAGFDLLATTAAPIADELQYLADLDTVWRARLRSVAAARGSDPVPPEAELAIDALVAEAGSIEDPHRAIDWLSTLPQVALAALREEA